MLPSPYRLIHCNGLCLLAQFLARCHATQISLSHVNISRQFMPSVAPSKPDRLAPLVPVVRISRWPSVGRVDSFGKDVGFFGTDWGSTGAIILAIVVVTGICSVYAVSYAFFSNDSDARLSKNIGSDQHSPEENDAEEETPEKKPPPASCAYWCTTATIFVVFLASLVCLLAPLYVGGLLKRLIEHYDVAFLGVEVHLDKLDVYPFTGIVSADGLTVDNPPGWKTNHLLSVSSIYLDFNMGGLILSLGKSIGVDELLVKGVNVIYEKSLSTSNIYEVLEHVRKKLAQDKKASRTSHDSGSLTLQKVDIVNVTVRAALYSVGGVDLVVPNITSNNFEQKLHGDGDVSFIVELILDMLLTNVLRALATVVGTDVVTPKPS